MDSERILKKSMFGGFKREDVIDYIEKLQAENSTLAQEVRDLSSRNADINELKNEIVSLKEQNEKYRLEFEELSTKAAELEKNNSELIAKKSPFFVPADAAGTSPLIQDAMKYSDTIVKSATETAQTVIDKAATSINASGDEITTEIQRIKTAQSNLEYSLNAVSESMEKLIECLRENVKELTGE